MGRNEPICSRNNRWNDVMAAKILAAKILVAKILAAKPETRPPLPR
jgi:hypothetical protein